MRLSPNVPRAGLSLLVALAGCRQPDATPASRDREAERQGSDVVIGVAWPWANRPDVRFGAGLDLAADEINRGGGVLGRRVRLVKVDDHESVNDGRVVAQQLSARSDVVAVIGHLQSYVSVPAAAIYDLAGIVMLAPIATAPELTAQGYGRVFRGTVNDRGVGRGLADAASARGFRRIAVAYVRSGYGRNVSNAFEERASELGMEIVTRDSYDPNATEDERAFREVLAAWAGARFDAILLAGENPSGAALVAAARRAGITQPVLAGDAMSSASLVQVAGPAANGTIVATVFHPDEPRPEVRTFVKAFTSRYGVPPDVGAAVGYDALHTLVDAMRRANSVAPTAIAAALHGGSSYAGVTGRFAFDATGERTEQHVVLTVVEAGQFRFLAPPRVASAAP